MSKFLDKLILEDTGTSTHGRAKFKLLDSFRYEVGCRHTGMIVIVPQGYVTDFATIPRLFWRILPPAGAYRFATVIHDYLCSSKLVSRQVADAVFLDAMVCLGVPWWKRTLVYSGVRTYAHIMRI